MCIHKLSALPTEHQHHQLSENSSRPPSIFVCGQVFVICHREWWVVEMLTWLSVWSEVQMICICSSWCHCHPIISCSSKIQNGLPFWSRLTQVVLAVVFAAGTNCETLFWGLILKVEHWTATSSAEWSCYILVCGQLLTMCSIVGHLPQEPIVRHCLKMICNGFSQNWCKSHF